jgi:hypothetical protein
MSKSNESLSFSKSFSQMLRISNDVTSSQVWRMKINFEKRQFNSRKKKKIEIQKNDYQSLQ